MVVGDFVTELETVVIGSGPGGYVAAIRAAQMGLKVTIVERDAIGGVCLNVGCIPSKALISASQRYQDFYHSDMMGITTDAVHVDFTKLQDWKQNKVVRKLTSGVEMLLKKNKIDILRGSAYFTDDHQFRLITDTLSQAYSFKNLILATGSRPTVVSGFTFGKRILDSTGALNLKEIPKHLIVIGGGYIGSELAGVYANLGSKITILQRSQTILRGFDPDMVKLVVKKFKQHDATIINFAKNMEAKESDDKVVVSYELDGVKHEVEGDYVLVSTGRTPNTDNIGLEATGVLVNDKQQIIVDNQGRTNIPHIFAIGDIVSGLPLAHKASYEAKIAAEAIAGENVIIDYKAIPAICFTDLELATVGLTKEDALKQGLEIKVSDFPFAANGRALSLAKTEGFIRLVSDATTGMIIGAQIAGAGASDLIGEFVLAIEVGMNTEDIALTIHAHPTLGETIVDVAEVALGVPINI